MDTAELKAKVLIAWLRNRAALTGSTPQRLYTMGFLAGCDFGHQSMAEYATKSLEEALQIQAKS